MPQSGTKHSETSTLILDAAKREFSHYGFKKVTMREIARELDMGKASLYYYFRTKESLFGAVITREHDRFMTALGVRLSAHAPAAKKIEVFLVERSEYFNRVVNLNVLEVGLSMRLRPVFARIFDAFFEAELKVLRSIVQEGKKRGEFAVGSEEKVARAYLHTLQGLRLRFLRNLEARQLGPEEIAQLKREQQFVTEIFLRGIQQNGKTK